MPDTKAKLSTKPCSWGLGKIRIASRKLLSKLLVAGQSRIMQSSVANVHNSRLRNARDAGEKNILRSTNGKDSLLQLCPACLMLGGQGESFPFRRALKGAFLRGSAMR